MPSRQAPASPRRPMRRMQRTRSSRSPMERATAPLPSGELSSTNTTSQSQAVSRRSSRSIKSGILARSLKVGTTMVSSGAGRGAVALARVAAAGESAGRPCSALDGEPTFRRPFFGGTYCSVRASTLLAFRPCCETVAAGRQAPTLDEIAARRMSVAQPDADRRWYRGPAALAERLVERTGRLIADNSEGALVAAILVAFVGVWMLFWEISTATVDVHTDASEALVWAQHFAFGYKHPPMTGWLFALWFSAFPRQQWAVNLLNVTTSAIALAITWRLLRDHL